MEENGNVLQKTLVNWFCSDVLAGFCGAPERRNPPKNQGVTHTWSLADRETRSNRNFLYVHAPGHESLADRETRSNRNYLQLQDCSVCSLADRETRSNRNRVCGSI